MRCGLAAVGARTNIDRAGARKEPEQRAPLFAAAHAELEAFVKAQSVRPGGAQGRLELARLAASQGQALLTRALREEDAAVAKKAEQQFIAAGAGVGSGHQGAGRVGGRLQGRQCGQRKATREQLAKELLQARFDRASNYIDQALTYIDISSDAANRKRAEVVDKAKNAFTALA